MMSQVLGRGRPKSYADRVPVHATIAFCSKGSVVVNWSHASVICNHEAPGRTFGSR
jgi:hypothetical protein